MNELVDQFCASKHRWLIVTGATILIGLLTVLPLADEYAALRDARAELDEELVEVTRITADLPAFQERVERKLTELGEHERRTVSEAAVSEFRNRLIEFARESGCRVQRISFGGARTRPWLESDNVMQTEAPPADAKRTPFVVETRPVSLSVTGSTRAVEKMLSRIHKDGVVQHVKYLELRPAGANRQSVHMDIELWCYALSRA